MPDQQPSSVDVTPSQAAGAASAAVVADRIAEQEKRLSDSLDIRDPGQQRQTPESQVQAPLVAAQRSAGPTTLPGATPDGGLTPDLLGRASQFGISAEDARQTAPGVLSRLLDRLEYQGQQQQWQQPEPEPDYGSDFLFDPYTGQSYQQQNQLPELPRLDPNAVVPELAEPWNQMVDYLQQQQAIIAEQNQRLANTEQQFQQHAQAIQQQQNARDFQTLEGLIQKDDGYRDVLGEGPLQNIQGTRQHAARAEIANMMDAMRVNYAQRGQPSPDIETLYNRAKVAIHGDRQAQQQVQQAGNQVIERMRDRSGQFIRRPTATTRASDDLPHGVERAERAVASAMRNGTN